MISPKTEDDNSDVLESSDFWMRKWQDAGDNLFILNKKKRRKIVIVISSKTEDDSSVACNGLKYFLIEYFYFPVPAFFARYFFQAIIVWKCNKKILAKSRSIENKEILLHKLFYSIRYFMISTPLNCRWYKNVCMY